MSKFEEGHEKKGGREKGTPNKLDTQAKQLFINIMEGEVDHIKESFEKVRDKNPTMYLNLLSKFFPYFMPKQVDIKSDGEAIKQVFKIGDTEIEL